MNQSNDRGSFLPSAIRTLIALQLAGSAVSVHAQGEPIAVGSRVRVSTPTLTPVTRIGLFQGTRDSTLLLETRGASLTFPFASISRLEISGGRKRSTPGAIVGLLVGAGAGGFALGCLANRDDYGVLCGGQDDTKVVIGAVVGGLAGAAVGAVVFARERWMPVERARLRN